MTQDFWSSYVPGETVPSSVRKFLHRDTHNPAYGQTTGYYAYAYAGAFERLIMVAIHSWPQADYLRLPAFFLARHSAELHLKEVIQDYCAATGNLYDAAGIHSLVSLWNRVTKLMPIVPEDEWSAHVGRLIQHMHDFDPDGQRFRYPENNDGVPFLHTRVELEQLANAHGTITLWCEGAMDMLSASRE